MKFKGVHSVSEEAIAHLRNADPQLARVIDQVGPFRMVLRRGKFQVLIRAIMFQQLSGPSAQALYQRFVALFKPRTFPTPQDVLEVPTTMLRSIGLSQQKIMYLKDLAEHIVAGKLNLNGLSYLSDEEIIRELTKVKGIGRWTAEMFLMFNMGRPDVLPVDDLGLRNAVAQVYHIPNPPKPKELYELGERWRPYRTVAVWYLWQTQKPSPAGEGKNANRRNVRQPLD